MVYVMLATGFEEAEAITPIDLMRRAGIPVATVGVTGSVITGSHGIAVQADITLAEMDLTQLDMIMLPGGMQGVASLKASSEVLQALEFAYANGKFVAAICAAPTILAQLHITDGRSATCHPTCEASMSGAALVTDRPCVQDGTVITGASAGCAIPFALALIRALKGDDAAKAIAGQIVIR